VVLLLVAAGVWAASPGKEKIARTAAGNAQARAEVVRRPDVGAGWSGGFKKPDLSSTMPCSGYHPKQSDLVMVGAAETTWHKQIFEIDSEAEVLRTAAMVRLDWQRTVVAPQVPACLRQGFSKSLGASGKLVSFGRVAVPRVTTETRAFRAVADVKSGGLSIRFEIDLVAIGAGRNEITLMVSGPRAARASLTRTERRLARLLAHRVD
jgi:hypothetical protein